MKIGKALIAMAVVAVAGVGVGSARAEVYNQFCTAPSSYNADEFIIVFKGDITGEISTSATNSDPLLNPFTYVKNNITLTGTSNVTASYDSTANTTTVTYSGTNPILSTYTFNYGAKPHFGLDGSHGANITGGGPAFQVISQTWGDTTNSGNTTATPSLSVDVKNPPSSGPVDYIVFYANVTSAGATTGQWFELPFTLNTSPQLTLTNYTGSSETLSNAGYFISDTLIPLDNLNFGLTPPPGSSNSPFAPLPQYDGSQLTGGDGLGGAGGSITTQSLPEPSSLISMATGLVIAGGYVARRARARARARRRASAA